MGGHQVRREDVLGPGHGAPAGVRWGVRGRCGPAGLRGRGPRRAAIVGALLCAAIGAWADAGGPLPPVQGHQGEELYSFPFPDDAVIDRYVAGYLANRRDWLQVVLDRSRLYRAAIFQVLAERGLPQELFFLPAVESAFEPRATSPRGAVGIWQLMSNTASPYGLRMDQWVDERRDVYRATEASVSKLADNYHIFGDWSLALAAYNCGVGRLSGILKRNPDLDYWALRKKGALPTETAAFVPQFLALTKILSYPGRYGLSVGWDAPREMEQVSLTSCVDLRILARAASVPLAELTRANPELNFPITPPAAYHFFLKVPSEYADAVRAALDSAAVPLMNFMVHVVIPGDTLSELAEQYGITVDMLQEFNPQARPRALQIGAKLLVPMSPVRSAG